jgi:hypothetical protein
MTTKEYYMSFNTDDGYKFLFVHEPKKCSNAQSKCVVRAAVFKEVGLDDIVSHYG